jgi:hypothetical protein
MAITINAKGTSESNFAIGKGPGTSISQLGAITPPDGNDLTVALAADKYLVIDAGTAGPALITTTDAKDLHINPATGGGQYLLLNANRFPTADGTAGQQRFEYNDLGNICASIPGICSNIFSDYF